MPEAMNAVEARRPRRHIPQRTCVSCGTTTAKRELIRLVRTPDGGAEPDPTGKRPGRGAYLCHDPQCWERAAKKGRLDAALRTRLSPQSRSALLRYAAAHLGAEAS